MTRVIFTLLAVVLLHTVAVAQTLPRLRLNWTDNSADETGFKIETAPTTTGPWAQLITTAANATVYEHLNLAYSAHYCYRVASFNTAGQSAWSNVACATTMAPPITIPNPPSGLTLSAISSSTIEISWNDNATNETEQDFRWSSRQPPRSGEVVMAPNQVTHRMSGLKKRTTYCGKLYAVAGTVESAASNESCATTRR